MSKDQLASTVASYGLVRLTLAKLKGRRLPHREGISRGDVIDGGNGGCLWLHGTMSLRSQQSGGGGANGEVRGWWGGIWGGITFTT